MGWDVAPHMGAWIEIYLDTIRNNKILVAPHMGAWIEIILTSLSLAMIVVAPHMGAWIEIIGRMKKRKKHQSHPTWVRGL